MRSRDLIASRENDHRSLVDVLAERAEQVKPAAVGQMQIEKYEPVIHSPQGGFGIIEPLHPVNGMTGTLEMRCDCLAEHRLIFDQQKAHGAPSTSLSCGLH